MPLTAGEGESVPDAIPVWVVLMLDRLLPTGLLLATL